VEYIELRPKNWFYNLSVTGFLEVLADQNSEEIEKLIRDDGTVLINRKIFAKHRELDIPEALVRYVNYLVKGENLDEWLGSSRGQKSQKDQEKKKEKYKEKYKHLQDKFGEFGYKLARALNMLFGSKTPYQNLVQQSEWSHFFEFVTNLERISEKEDTEKCDICGGKWYLNLDKAAKFTRRLFRFASTHSSEFGSSVGDFPNAFWNNNSSLLVCPLCVYLIIHSHVAWTRLSDSTSIFINAPSFKVMWHLNKYAKELYGAGKVEGIKELFGMSLIELALKLNLQLGKWTMMNIEVVIKYKDKKGKVEFFSIPHEITMLLLDKSVASLLFDIGRTEVLSWFLDGEFDKILRDGERHFREALKSSDAKTLSYSQKLFELYALVNEKRKGGAL